MFLSAPIKPGGVLSGILVMEITIPKISSLITESTGLGETGECILIGEDYYFRAETRHLKKAGRTDVILVEKTDSIIVKNALKKKSGTTTGKDYRGKDVIVSFDFLDFGNFIWALEAKIDSTEALAPAFSLLYMIILISLILSAIIFFIAVLFAKSIVKPILAGVNFADMISNKDLSLKLEKGLIKKSDEIGSLARSLDTMSETLLHIIENLTDISSHVAASAEEIAAGAQNLAANAQNQASNVEETFASMEEFTGSINKVSESAKDIENKTNVLLIAANESKQLVDTAVNSINGINESSQRIADIISIINDISDQTNLLALNAAIEAARAGEYGRGFAVVADEIAKLADKSSGNTKEIEKLIKQSVKDLDSGTEIVKRAGEAFNNIILSINETGKLITEISKAVESQSNGANDVRKAIEDINDNTQNISSSTEQMAASTEELQSMAEKVKTLIEEFKIK